MTSGLTPNVARAGRLRARGDLAAARALLIDEAQRGTTPEVLSDLAAICLELGDLETAGVATGEAMRAPRAPVEAFVNAGLLARARGDSGAAEERLREGVARDGRHVPARLHLAGLLLDGGRLDEAATQLALALRQAPAEPIGLSLLGRVRFLQNRFAESLGAYRQADRAGADVRYALSQLARATAHVCDWRQRDETRQAMRGAIAAAPLRVRDGPVDLFAVMSHEDDPALQLAAARTMAAAVRAQAGPAPARPRAAPRGDRRLHVGYLSCDFHQHATAELLVGVLEQHDRDRFLVSAYSYGRDDGSAMQARVRAAPERFVPLGLEPAAASADRIAADGVDVLVDLNGYTGGARPGIAALRPAPVQLVWLGFPCTTGADWFDGVIADPVVLPIAEQPNWRERILHLPCCYQPNDDKRARPAPDRDRASHGLPADAPVLACLNRSDTITPERFALWMSLLRQIPEAVLWLLEGSEFAVANLRAAARQARIEPSRLVFAPVLEHAPHLARHGCADLMLDTAPYGAHATASNALGMGLPVVTVPGRSFASRVCASLLEAAGVSELIAPDEASYRALVTALVADPAKRRQLGERARAGALFDTRATVRALEDLLLREARPGLRPGPAGAVAPDPVI